MPHDAIIIGGSFAGLAAATYIARGRRDVAIIDAGQPRNRFAAHSHGFLTHDGSSPLDMLATAGLEVGPVSLQQLIVRTTQHAGGASDTSALEEGVLG